jgi:hypothetical protein
MEPFARPAVLICMMTNIQTVTRKIVQPIVLAIAMLFSTPLFGLMHNSAQPTQRAMDVANETVVFKTNTSVAFKS